MAQMSNTPLNFRGSHNTTFQQSGKTHGGTLADLIQNPKASATGGDVDNLRLAMEYLGAPPRVAPDALDAYPRDIESVASAFVGQSKQIAQIVVRGSVNNMAIRHFSILPPRPAAEDELQGMSVNILRLENTLPDLQPEGTAPRMVTHTYEKAFMRHNRWGMAMHLTHDFYRTADGRQLFNEQTNLMVMNMIILAQLTITSALIRAKDYYRRWRLYFSNDGGGASMGWSDMDMRFGCLNKKEKAWYTLSNWAKRMAQKSGNGGFTACLHAETIKEQIIYGSKFETEVYRRGPQATANLEQGNDAVARTPDGIELIEEPSYLLQNVGQKGDEATQLLVSPVQLGRVGYVNPLDPMMKGTWDYHYLNLDKGDAEICVQDYHDLLMAALCWDDDGSLDSHCYTALTQGDRAERFAADQLGIRTLAPTTDPDDVPDIDPFIAMVDGRPQVVHYQGNQDQRHCSFKTQSEIVECALQKLQSGLEYVTDMQAIRGMLEMANRNYNVAADSQGDVEGFIWASAQTNGNNTVNGQRGAIPTPDGPDFVDANEYGAIDLPSLFESDLGAGRRGYFLGVDDQRLVAKTVVQTAPSVPEGPGGDGDDREDRGGGDVIGGGAGAMQFVPVVYNASGVPVNAVGREARRLRVQNMFPSYAAVPNSPINANAPYYIQGPFGGPANTFRAVLVASVANGQTDFTGGLRGTLPGFSNMSHMRYLAEAYRTGSAGAWLNLPEYENMMRVISEGMYALDRMTTAIRNCWSIPERPNLFFDGRNLPFYQRPEDSDLASLMTYQQDVVQGVRYAVGIQASGTYGIAGNDSRIQVRRTGGIPPPGDDNDDFSRENYTGLWRPGLNYTIGDQSAAAGVPAAQERVQSGAPRNAVGGNERTYPGSGLEWMNDMGFVNDRTDRDAGEMGVAAFQAGQMEGDLLLKMQSAAGVREWIAKYNANAITRPENTGLEGGWAEMAQRIYSLAQASPGWASNPSNSNRGAALGRIVSGIDLTLEEGGTINKERLNHLVAFSTNFNYRRRRLVGQDGRVQSGPPMSADSSDKAARDLVKALYGPDAQLESYTPRYLNTRLSLSPNYWKEAGAKVANLLGIRNKTLGATMSILRPTNPDAPNSSYLGLTPDFALLLDYALFGGAVNPQFNGGVVDRLGTAGAVQQASVFAEDIIRHARARPAYSMEATLLDPVVRRLSENPKVQAQAPKAGARASKRARMAPMHDTSDMDDMLPQKAGGRLFYVPPSRPPARAEPEYGEWYRSSLEGSGGSTDAGLTSTAMNEYAPGPHYAPMHRFEHAIPGVSDFAPNQHWTDRWNATLRSASHDLPRRMLHIAFMGLPIHAKAFANLHRCGIPPPITLLPADPFMDFRMTSMIFVQAGEQTGFLSYFLRDMTVSYDGSYKLLYGHLTSWFGALVKIIENVLVVDHVSFDRYLRGADGSLVRTVFTQGKNNPSQDHIDFDINEPTNRRAHRFVLYAGASYSEKQMPDPVPLTGSYGTGNYGGFGHFVSNDDVGRTMAGQAYPSAVLTNYKTGFWRLNHGVGSVTDDQLSFEGRVSIAERAFNLLLSRANQWGVNPATNDMKRRIKNGTGPLGPLTEGVGHILNGSPGVFSEVLERVEGGR